MRGLSRAWGGRSGGGGENGCRSEEYFRGWMGCLWEGIWLDSLNLDPMDAMV